MVTFNERVREAMQNVDESQIDALSAEGARKLGYELTSAAVQQAVTGIRPGKSLLPTTETRTEFLKGQLRGLCEVAISVATVIARPDAWIVEVDDHDEAMIRAVNELYKVPTSELYEHVIVAATEISVKLVALLSKQSPPSETEASS